MHLRKANFVKVKFGEFAVILNVWLRQTIRGQDDEYGKIKDCIPCYYSYGGAVYFDWLGEDLQQSTAGTSNATVDRNVPLMIYYPKNPLTI